MVNKLREHAQGVLVGELDAIVLSALAQDRQPSGELGRDDVRHQAGLETLT